MPKRVTIASLQLELAETREELAETKKALATAEQKLEGEIRIRRTAEKAAASSRRAWVDTLIDQEKNFR